MQQLSPNNSNKKIQTDFLLIAFNFGFILKICAIDCNGYSQQRGCVMQIKNLSFLSRYFLHVKDYKASRKLLDYITTQKHLNRKNTDFLTAE